MPRFGQVGAGWRAMLALLGCALLAGWVGCNEKEHYKTLSFFFDGVPNPNALATTQASGGIASGSGAAGVVFLSVHKPYLEKNCEVCHEKATNAVIGAALDSTGCVKCHEKVPAAHKVMHAPVLGQACLWCHQPHQSQYAHLLKTTLPTLCLQCHERELLSTGTAGHAPGSQSCLECHVGHGGEKRPFLRAKGS